MEDIEDCADEEFEDCTQNYLEGWTDKELLGAYITVGLEVVNRTRGIASDFPTLAELSFDRLAIRGPNSPVEMGVTT